jgi:hypothetical protein
MTKQRHLLVGGAVGVIAVTECVVKTDAMHGFTYGGELGSSVR